MRETDKVFCYYGDWAVYRQYNIEDIDLTRCSHIIYAFVGLNPDGTIRIIDDWAANGLKGLSRFGALRKRNPRLKVMVAMGGWNEGSATYSDVTSNPTTRARLVNSVYSFLTQWNFDGFDLDWEYPGKRTGSRSSDRVSVFIWSHILFSHSRQLSWTKFNYISFLRDLRRRLGQRYLITAAVGADIGLISNNYIVPALNQWLDYINLMTYDFNSYYGQRLGQNAPLYASPNDANPNYNMEATIKAWLKAGASAQKLVLGLGFYAQTFKLANKAQTQIGSPLAGPGNQGSRSRQPGLLMYSEICDELALGGWTVRYDQQQQSVIAYKGDQWWGYDNVQSIKAKSQYAVNNNLAGVMVWSVDYDDKNGRCGQGRNPLLGAISSVIRIWKKNTIKMKEPLKNCFIDSRKTVKVEWINSIHKYVVHFCISNLD